MATVGGVTDFSADFARGAQIGNMQVQQRERMIELQGQEALRRVQERHLAAQADALAYQLQQAQADKAEQDKVLQIADVTHQTMVSKLVSQGMPQATAEEKATQATDTWMANSYPKVAVAVGNARATLAKSKLEEAQAEMDKRRFSVENQSFQPTIEGITDPTTGRKVPVLRTGPKSAQMVESKAPDKVQELQRVHEAATSTDDPELSKLYQALEVKLTQATGMTIKTNPDGTFEITQGPVGGPDQLTKTNQSKVQEQQAKALETVDTAQRLKPLLDKDTVGAEAFAKSWINDRILAQRFPELASTKRAQASQLISQLRADAVKTFKSDGNISDRERNEILASFPKVNDPIDSASRAKMVVEQTETMAAIEAVTASKRLGGEIPKAAALTLDDENVAGMVKRGVIAPELAMKIWKMKRQ